MGTIYGRPAAVVVEMKVGQVHVDQAALSITPSVINESEARDGTGL